MSSSRLILLAALAIVCMAFVPVLVYATQANSITIAIARLAFASAVFLPIVFWRSSLRGIPARDWSSMLIIGAVFAAHWLTYFQSIKLSSAAIGALAMATYSVQYLFLAWMFNGERIGVAEWLGIALCFIGCAIVVPEFRLGNDVTLGVLAGVISATLYACLPLLHQRAARQETLVRTFGQFGFALLVLLPFWGYSDWSLQKNDWYQLLALALVCTVIAHGLWVKASTELPALFTSVIYYLYVPLTLITSAIFLEEEMTPEKLIGATMIVVAGSAVMIYRFRSQTHKEIS